MKYFVNRARALARWTTKVRSGSCQEYLTVTVALPGTDQCHSASAKSYRRTIFSDSMPRMALRVSTISFEKSSSAL
jgi:hypothetical protein